MNLIRATPSFILLQNYSPFERHTSGAELSPWVVWQDLTGGHLENVSSQSQSKCFVTLTKLLQHDSVTLSVCWIGCNVPSRMYSNKSNKINKWREWWEQGSEGRQPQCFLNNMHLNSQIWWRIGRRKRCQWGLSVSCGDIRRVQKHNAASIL